MTNLRRSRDVIETDLGDELILLDSRNGNMYSLNECARLVWLELPAPSTQRIAETISAEFDVLPEHAAADAELLIAALEDAGLVEREHGAA